MEMDFRSLKRRDLQKLCKKHGLRANSTNSQMVDSLASLFKLLEKNKQIKGCLKGSCGSSASEGERVQGILKKVTFVLNEEKESDAVLCSRNGNCSPRRRSSRRLSKVFDETQDVGIVKKTTEGCAVPVRTTRSRSRISGVMCSPVREKKKARRSGEVTRKNVQVLSGKGEDSKIGTGKEDMSEMIPIRTIRNGVVVAGEANAKRKRDMRNSSVEFNNEGIVSLPVEVVKTIDLVSEEENSCARTLTTKSLREVSKIIDLVNKEEVLCTRPFLATKSLTEVSDIVNLVIEEQNLCARLLATKPQNMMGAVSSNVEEIWETPLGERTVEKSNNAQISLSIDRHDDHKLCSLVECDSEVVGTQNSNFVVLKKDEDLKTLAFGGDGALEESTSIQLEDFDETPKATSNAVITLEDSGLLCDKFQEKATDNSQANTTAASPDICTNSPYGSKDMTECVDAEQESKTSPSFGREIIKPQNQIVSSIIEDYSTVVGNHFGCIEFDENDASSTKELCHSNNYALSPDLKKLSECKAHLDTNELEDAKFLKEKQDFTEFEVPEDSNVEENRSSLCPQSYGSGEMQNGINLLVVEGYDEKVTEKSETIQKTPDSRLDTEHAELFATNESGILLAENGSYLCLQSYQSSDKKNGINFLGNDENIREKSEAIQEFPSSIRLEEAELGDFFAKNESVILLHERSQIEGGDSLAFKDNNHVNQDKFKHVGENFCSASEPQAIGSVKALEIENHAGNLLEKMEEIAPCELGKRFDNIMERMICLKKVLRGEIAPFGIVSALSHLSEKEMSCQEPHSTSKNEMSLGEPYTAQYKEEMQVLTPLMLANSVDELNGSEANSKGKTDEIAIASSLDVLQGNPESWKSWESCEANDTDIAAPFECYLSYIKPIEGESCPGGYADSKEFLEIEQGALAKPIEVLEKIMFVSPSIELEGERNFDSSYFLEKNKLGNSINNSPKEDDKYVGIPYLSETLDAQSSLSIKHASAKYPVGLLAMESHEDSLLSMACDVPPEMKAPFNSYSTDIVEECDLSNIKSAEGEQPCQCVSVKYNKEVVQKIKFVSPCKESSIDLEIERSFGVSCISEKSKMSNSMNIPAKEDKHVGIPCLSGTLDGHNSLSEMNGPIEECYLSYTKSAGGEPCRDGNLDAREYLITGEVLQKIELFPPREKSFVDLEGDRSSGTSCISEKSKFSKSMSNSPAIDIKHCLPKTLHGHSSLLISEANSEHLLDPLTIESEDSSLSRTDTISDVVPSECKAPFRDSIVDPIEEITRKLITFTISSGLKATKTDILSSPTKSAGNFNFYTSVSRLRGKENTPSTKMNYSNCKMRSTISAGSGRRPLQSVTNQMLD